MKSICGYWALDGAPVPAHVLERMRTAHIRCDAPHLEAWRDDALAFGSAWWSPQPGLTPPQCIARHRETGCVVVADARLDNPAELRAALDFPAPPDAPDASTDHAAAILLHAWLRWGEDCVDRIDGDFAFAVHDPRRQRLFLARDRMGERPLYLHHVPGKLLVFGSTSQAVLAHPRVPRDLNEARIGDYLLECASGALEGVDFTSTFYQAVERHPPRHVRLVDARGEQLRQYWTLEPHRAGPLPKTDGEWLEALTAAMERAVAQRLAGPLRAGSMLSGGLDSTSLAIVAGDQLHAAGKPPLPTFSVIDSNRRDCLETQAIRTAAAMPIFNPTLIDIADLGSLRPELERFLDEYDEPFDANMTLIDAQYAAAAKAGVGALIDGADGDIVFLFGNVMRRQLRSGHWRAAWRNAQGLSRSGWRPWDYLRLALRAALVPDLLRAGLAPWRARRYYQTQLNDRSAILPAFARRIDLEGRRRQLGALRTATAAHDPVREYAEALLHTFPLIAAERYHRVAARHGVAKLAPFAERQLLELCIHLPDALRLRDGWSKHALRAVMRQRMPESVRLRGDKQHLGGRLTLHLLEGRPLPSPQDLATHPRLADYLDKEKLAAFGAAPVQPAAPLLNAMWLAQWLDRGP
ncbi:MAG: asparagine synthase-related protein [Pseudoxanthomonas sp.]